MVQLRLLPGGLRLPQSPLEALPRLMLFIGVDEDPVKELRGPVRTAGQAAGGVEPVVGAVLVAQAVFHVKGLLPRGILHHRFVSAQYPRLILRVELSGPRFKGIGKLLFRVEAQHLPQRVGPFHGDPLPPFIERQVPGAGGHGLVDIPEGDDLLLQLFPIGVLLPGVPQKQGALACLVDGQAVDIQMKFPRLVPHLQSCGALFKGRRIKRSHPLACAIRAQRQEAVAHQLCPGPPRQRFQRLIAAEKAPVCRTAGLIQLHADNAKRQGAVFEHGDQGFFSAILHRSLHLPVSIEYSCLFIADFYIFFHFRGGVICSPSV